MKHTGVAVLALLLGCGGDDGPPPLFPADYAATYQEVRNCRNSLDHDLMRIRVLASPDAVTAYMNRTDAFRTGAILLKEQYDSGDRDCTGQILTYTVMQKLDVGTASADLDWAWQETDHEMKVITDEEGPRCVGCHTDCGKPPEGYDGTCTVP